MKIDALKSAIIFFFITALCSCGGAFEIKEVPEGSWNYNILMNNLKVGDSTVSSVKQDKRYIYESRFIIDFAGVRNSISHRIVETLDFEPVSIETFSMTERGSMRIDLSTKAQFDGQMVILETENKKSVFEIESPFVLEGNYLIGRLIEKGANPGLEFSYNLYDPSIEPEEVIPVRAEIKGYRRVTVNDRTRRLLHLKFSIQDIKMMNTYLDEQGVVQKMDMTMLNNTIVLELKEEF